MTHFDSMDNLIATARRNKIATTVPCRILASKKLRKDYAGSIVNITDNINSDQLMRGMIILRSEPFGKIMQDR